MDNVVQDVGCKSVSLRLGSRHDLVMMNRSLYRKKRSRILIQWPDDWDREDLVPRLMGATTEMCFKGVIVADVWDCRHPRWDLIKEQGQDERATISVQQLTLLRHHHG